MLFFINSGVCDNRWYETTKSTYLPDSRVELEILGYLKDKKCEEIIKFIFPKIDKNSFKECIFLEDIALKKSKRNTYEICKSEKSNNHHMYALLRNTRNVPGDIFIPASMKDKVKVIKKIQSFDCEVDYGDFLSNTYFIKIILKPGEFIPVYFTSTTPAALTKHIIFYKDYCDKRYYVYEYLDTFIPLSKFNENEYISLSSICD